MTVANYPPALFSRVIVDRCTEPFWTAAREHRLVVPMCSACATIRMPPGPYCPHCRSISVTWLTLPGTGEIYSYTIVSRAVIPEMNGHLPYVPAVVTLDEAPGIRLISALVECDVEKIGIGGPVRVLWRPAADGQELPFFTPIEAAESTRSAPSQKENLYARK